MCGWTHWHHIEEEVRRRNQAVLVVMGALPFAMGEGALQHVGVGWRRHAAPVRRRGASKIGKPSPSDYPRLVHSGSPHASTRSATIAGRCASFEPLPRLHRPARWDAPRIQRVSEEVSRALEQLLPRVEGIPVVIGGRCMVISCPGICERIRKGNCGCSIGRTQSGGRPLPTSSATSWPIIHSAGLVLLVSRPLSHRPSAANRYLRSRRSPPSGCHIAISLRKRAARESRGDARRIPLVPLAKVAAFHVIGAPPTSV